MIGQEQKIEDEDMRNENKSCWRKGEQSRIAQPGGEREGGRGKTSRHARENAEAKA